MRDDERRAALHEARQRVLHLNFGCGVERGGRLVEQQNGGILQHGARDGDALALPAGKLEPGLTDQRVVAFGQRCDELMRGRVAGGLLDFGIGGAGRAIGDVGADRVVEEKGFLRDERACGAQRTQCDVARILPVDEDAAGGRIVETRHEVEDRALAGAGRTDERDRVALRNLDVDAVERRRTVAIMEVDILEADRAILDVERFRVFGRRNARLDVENGKDARRRRHAFMHQRLRIGELLQRLIGEQHGGEKAAEIADGEEACLHAAAAEIDDRGDTDAGKHAGDGARHAARLDGFHRIMAHAVDGTRGACALGRLLVIGLDDADALERLGDDGGQVARAFHVELRRLARAPPELPDDEADDGNDRRAHQGELPVEPEHGADEREDGEEVLPEVDHRGGDGVAHAVCVVEKTGDEAARMGVRNPGKIGMHDLREHALLDRSDDVLTDLCHVDPRDIGRDGLHRGGGYGAGGDEEQHPGVRADDVVEGELDEHGHGAGRARDHEAGEKRDDGRPPVRLQVFPRHAGKDASHADFGHWQRRHGIGAGRRPRSGLTGSGVGRLARHSGLSLWGALGRRRPVRRAPVQRAPVQRDCADNITGEALPP